MSFLEFRKEFAELGYADIHQILASHPDFDRNNLTRWARRGLIVKLRQGLYSFPEMTGTCNWNLFLSNLMYRPSYVSLHTALAFYGMIPEAVTQVVAVSSLKTASFENSFGSFSYHTVSERLLFGYDRKPFGSRSILLASPEKAILDLLYIYPFYRTVDDMRELRLDEDFLSDSLDIVRLDEFAESFRCRSLTERLLTLKKTYYL